MKKCCEYICGIQYKLGMMVIAVNVTSYIFGDNKYVLCNTTITDSMVKNKAQSISYYLVRGGEKKDEWRTAYINTHDNPADFLAKLIPMS